LGNTLRQHKDGSIDLLFTEIMLVYLQTLKNYWNENCGQNTQFNKHISQQILMFCWPCTSVQL